MYLLIILVLAPVIWQIPRIFWPLQLNASGTQFTGLYRRYSVESFTGFASDISQWTVTRTIGGLSGHASGQVYGDTFTGTYSVSDNRKEFITRHTGFFLADQSGSTHQVDSANVVPAIGEGHLVSAAWRVHNGKPGTAFLVYNHTTNNAYVEASRRKQYAGRRGLEKMVFRLPTLYVILLTLGIVTIPLVVLFAYSTQLQLRIFRNHGIRPLTAEVERRAAEFPSTRLEVGGAPGAPVVRSLASQVKEIADLHESGALTHEEFRAAKSKLLDS